jgi:hypothetical protein
VVRLHRILSSVVSDRDLVFTSNFWKELFMLARIKLCLSSAFHPNRAANQRRQTKLS